MDDERRRIVTDLPNRLLQVRNRAAKTASERAILDRLGALLDGTDLAALADQLIPSGKEGVSLYQEKLLDIPARVLKETRRVYRLGLDRPPVRRILDIGAGSGVFCWVARQFGHDVLALEPPSKPQSIDLPAFIRFFGVPHAEQLILPQVPLAIGRFHLVTSFAIMFNHSRDEAILSYWTAEDYRFFLEDLQRDVMIPGGRVLLQFNVALYGKPSSFVPPGIVEYYAALGRFLLPCIVEESTDGILIDPSRSPGTNDLPLPPPEETVVDRLRQAARAREETRKERKRARIGFS